MAFEAVWATNREGVGLIVRAISFQISNLCDHDLPSQTNGRTDIRTCDRKTVLCSLHYNASRSKKNMHAILLLILRYVFRHSGIHFGSSLNRFSVQQSGLGRQRIYWSQYGATRCVLQQSRVHRNGNTRAWGSRTTLLAIWYPDISESRHFQPACVSVVKCSVSVRGLRIHKFHVLG